MQQLIKNILNEYNLSSTVVSKSNPIYLCITREIPNEIKSCLATYSGFNVRGSMGQGNKAEVPWISVMDERITKSTQNGLYVVYLFKSDMSGIYLTLNQGITYFEGDYKSKANEKAKEVSDYLRGQVHDVYFSKDQISLGNGSKAKGYAATTIISKYYSADSLPDDSVLLGDLLRMYGIYNSICDSIADFKYENFVKKVVSGYVGDISSMTGKTYEDKRFKWVDFYKEMADKILVYKNNHPGLIKIVDDAFDACGYKNPLRMKESITSLLDLDPFTFYSTVNRAPFSSNNKINILKEYKKSLHIIAEVPTNFDGIPTKNSQKSWFTDGAPIYNTQNKAVDDLWDLFEASIKLADGDSGFKTKFCDSFLRCVNGKNVGNGATFGLYWIRPEFFVGFDNNMRELLKAQDVVTDTELNEAMSVNGKYLELNEKIKSKMGSMKPPFKTIYEMSNYAYLSKGFTEENTMTGYNKIYYGMPGCGKSYQIKKLTENVGDDKVFRVTFYQDYSYSDFIGQIMPVTKTDLSGNKILSYDFVPGPFTKALKKALDPEVNNENVYLIIEEINRGNAPSIFGDVFQLLDRDDDDESDTYGQSEYPITNDLITSYLGINSKLYIPSNLIILATMNTSDQNVFTLDTAFKRRWELEEVRNDFTNHPYAKKFIPGTDKTWSSFVIGINRAITSLQSDYNSSEDKRLGA